MGKMFPADAFCTFATIVAAKENMTPQQRRESLARACGVTIHAVNLRLLHAKKLGIKWKELELPKNKKTRPRTLKLICRSTAPALKSLIKRTKKKLLEKAAI